MRAFVAILLATSCGGGGGGSEPAGPLDPTTLAPLVSQSELETSIKGLQDLGTRYTIGTGDERAKDYLVQRIQAMGLTAELDPFTVSNETANNIIVKHTGTVDPNVVYLYSAHYDSTSNAPATSAPGADDNATGVAAVLEAMRLLTKHS